MEWDAHCKRHEPKFKKKKKIERRKTDSWWQIGIFMMLSKVLMHNHIYGLCRRIMDSFEMFPREQSHSHSFSCCCRSVCCCCCFSFCWFFSPVRVVSLVAVLLLLGIFCLHAFNKCKFKLKIVCLFRWMCSMWLAIFFRLCCWSHGGLHQFWTEWHFKSVQLYCIAMFWTMMSSCFKWFHVCAWDTCTPNRPFQIHS